MTLCYLDLQSAVACDDSGDGAHRPRHPAPTQVTHGEATSGEVTSGEATSGEVTSGEVTSEATQAHGAGFTVRDGKASGPARKPAPDDQGARAGDARFRTLVVVVSVVVSVFVFYGRFRDKPSLPDMPPRPAGALERARAVADDVGVSDRAYRERIARDARRVSAATEPEHMLRVFAYRHDTPNRSLSRTGEEAATLRAAGLKLTLDVEASPDSRRAHMVLSIENLLPEHVAYHVDTAPGLSERACGQKQTLPHNAIALRPGETVRRIECVYERGSELEIRRVETLEIPELGYYYTSQLRPRDLQLSRRTTAGHRPAGDAVCDLFLPARVERALASGEIGFKDAADFFARHDCRHFTIPADYRAIRDQGELTLPIVSPTR